MLLGTPLAKYPSKFAYSQSIDEEEMETKADYCITLENLNEQRITKKLEKLNKKYSKYSLATKNCSNLVIEILKIGSEKTEPSISQKLYDVYQNFMEIGDFVNYLNKMNYVFKTGESYNFSPMKVGGAIFKLCGGQTPFTVYNYTQFLKKNIG